MKEKYSISIVVFPKETDLPELLYSLDVVFSTSVVSF